MSEEWASLPSGALGVVCGVTEPHHECQTAHVHHSSVDYDQFWVLCWQFSAQFSLLFGTEDTLCLLTMATEDQLHPWSLTPDAAQGTVHYQVTKLTVPCPCQMSLVSGIYGTSGL